MSVLSRHRLYLLVVSLAVLLATSGPAATAAPVRSVLLVAPDRGAVEVAVLHFAAQPRRPVLTISGTGRLSKSTALVSGISRWHDNPTSYTGLIAIAAFGTSRRADVRVSSSAPFTLDFRGPVRSGCGSHGVCPPAALQDAAQLTGWSVGPSILPAAGLEPVFRTAAGILAEVTDALVGVPHARFLNALAGRRSAPKPGKTTTGKTTTTPAPSSTSGLAAGAVLIAQPNGSLDLKIQNSGTATITSVTLLPIDFTINSLASAGSSGCRITAPGLLCDSGFAIPPGQSAQFTIASYTCCLIGGQVWVNNQPGTSGQTGPIVATLG